MYGRTVCFTRHKQNQEPCLPQTNVAGSIDLKKASTVPQVKNSSNFVKAEGDVFFFPELFQKDRERISVIHLLMEFIHTSLADHPSDRNSVDKKPKPSKDEGPSLMELSGFNEKRQEFDPEYDNEAEQLLADMEFKETDTEEERELKLRVLRIYSMRYIIYLLVKKKKILKRYPVAIYCSLP